MTATCTICGDPVTVVDDVRGPDVTIGILGQVYQHHLFQIHRKVPQSCVDQNIIQGTIPQFIGAMGVSIQGLILLSYLTSEDEGFLKQVEQMRSVITQAIQQKVSVPKVVL